MPSDTSDPATAPPPPDASKAQSSFIQVIVGYAQFWWYLPRNILMLRSDLSTLAGAYEQLVQQHGQAINALNHALRRLQYYEQNIPRMRDLRHDFDLEQQGVKQPKAGSRIQLLSS